MSWSDRALEAAVGGASGLIVVAIFIVTRAWLHGVSDGDWLQFAGVIIGVALTITGAKLVDEVGSRARRARCKHDFTLAVRAVATGLARMTDGPAEQLTVTSISVASLWRTAEAMIDGLPDLPFEQRALIGNTRDALSFSLPNLSSNAMLIATNPGLVQTVREGAASLGLVVLPLTELFEKK